MSKPKRARAGRWATRDTKPRCPRWRWPTCSTDSMSKPRVETRARARVLQALYAWDLRPKAKLEQVATQIWDDLAIEPEEREFASRLIRTFSAKQAQIDAALTEVTENWRL